MNTPNSSKAPAKLYAFQLKLRPLKQGTLMAFSGELVHGALLYWLKNDAPDVGTWLHDGNKRRLFTCSSLHFHLSPQRMLDAERGNIHLPLDPDKTYTVRITLLLGELFPLFYSALMHFNTTDIGADKPSFIQIGKQLFNLEEVILNNDDPTGWTGFTSLTTLVEKAKVLRLGRVEPLKLEFASLTTFNRTSARSREYGVHHALLPLPQYIFPGLARRWVDMAPPDLVHVIQRDRIEQFIQDDGIIIADYELKTHQVKFTTHTQPGFVGNCTFDLRGPDEAITPEAPLTVRQQLLLLAQLAFYSGIGYKTSMGLGQARPGPRGRPKPQRATTRDRPYYGRLTLHDREAAVGAVPLTSGVTLLSTKVEYKHGQQGEWLNDAIQVCAQALCLEVCWKEKEDDE